MVETGLDHSSVEMMSIPLLIRTTGMAFTHRFQTFMTLRSFGHFRCVWNCKIYTYISDLLIYYLFTSLYFLLLSQTFVVSATS